MSGVTFTWTETTLIDGVAYVRQEEADAYVLPCLDCRERAERAEAALTECLAAMELCGQPLGTLMSRAAWNQAVSRARAALSRLSEAPKEIATGTSGQMLIDGEWKTP